MRVWLILTAPLVAVPSPAGPVPRRCAAARAALLRPPGGVQAGGQPHKDRRQEQPGAAAARQVRQSLVIVRTYCHRCWQMPPPVKPLRFSLKPACPRQLASVYPVLSRVLCGSVESMSPAGTCPKWWRTRPRRRTARPARFTTSWRAACGTRARRSSSRCVIHIEHAVLYNSCRQKAVAIAGSWCAWHDRLVAVSGVLTCSI